MHGIDEKGVTKTCRI